MDVDVSKTLEFRASPTRLFMIAVGSLAMVAASFAVAWPLLSNVKPGSYIQFVGWAGVPLFSAAFTVAVCRSFRINRPILTLSPQGLRDTRIASEFVPWNAVEKLSVWSYRGTKFVVVKVQDSMWQTLLPTWTARWARSANLKMGVDGLSIATTELGVKFDELMLAMTRYTKTYGGKVD